MRGILIIARKEFVDLISSPMVFLVIAAFLFYSVSMIWDFSVLISGGRPGFGALFDENPGVAANNNIFVALTCFGSVIGIIIGCSMVSSERIGSALNTLVVKPVYRDTIINGKLLGSFAFLAFVMLFFIVFYTAGFLVFCGGILAPFLVDYIARLPFVFLFSMAFVMVFLSLSVLISLLVWDQAFAMVLSTLVVYLSYNFTVAVSYNLNNIFPGYRIGSVLSGFSPYSLLWEGGVQSALMDTSLGAWDAFQNVLPDFVKLLLFVIVVLVLSYISFVRRDIS